MEFCLCDFCGSTGKCFLTKNYMYCCQQCLDDEAENCSYSDLPQAGANVIEVKDYYIPETNWVDLPQDLVDDIWAKYRDMITQGAITTSGTIPQAHSNMTACSGVYEYADLEETFQKEYLDPLEKYLANQPHPAGTGIAATEPVCHCQDLILGHSTGCAWKDWKENR